MVKPFFLFLRNSFGIFSNPYVTFRGISLSESSKNQIVFIHALVFIYFFLSSIVKTGLRNPYLLTLKFNSLYFSSYFGFIMMLFLFFTAYKLVSRENFPFNRLLTLWSYTLWPTLFWFFFTSLMYLILPPPRTFTYPGKVYSLVYLAFSLTILFWKLILYYLTLRFGLRFDLYKIILSSLIILPAVFAFSVFMYRLSIFKIPFL